jgi:mannose-6-phosphate isomerase
MGDGLERTVPRVGLYFALERRTAATTAPPVRTFSTAQILTSAGAPVTVTY